MKKTITEIITELTGQVPVQYSGELKAIRCPFHDDHSPSLVIYSQTNSYYCYPCGVGGDIYNFVSKFKGISYRASKELLDGDSTLQEDCTMLLDGLHIKEEIDYSQELNMSVSKYCRDLMHRRPELVNNVMGFLKNLDKTLQSPVTYATLEQKMKESRELDK